MLDVDEARKRVRHFHERSKHHLRRFAAGPGHLDWETQPEPFRRYAGCPVVELPLAAGRERAAFEDLFIPGRVPPRALDLEALGVFFELALGLSAWKEIQTARWALRNNPSSGNLHPTEGYLITGSIPGLEGGVYHYASREHSLEWRRSLEDSPCFPPRTFLVGLSSIHWREAWKYGERAFRYCQHDIGHAVAALRVSAAVLGWTCRLLTEPSDDDVEALLGLRDPASLGEIDPADREAPDLLLLVTSPDQVEAAMSWVATAVSDLVASETKVTWHGTANPLSPARVHWHAIDDVAEACRKPRTHEPAMSLAPNPADKAGPVPSQATTDQGTATHPELSEVVIAITSGGGGGDGSGSDGGGGGSGDDDGNDGSCGNGGSAGGLVTSSPAPLAVTIIRQRRSCTALDGVTRQSRASFLRILQALEARPGVPPWDALPWSPRLHLLLFVHRVDDLEPGLYFLSRRPGLVDEIRASIGTPFDWEPIPLHANPSDGRPGTLSGSSPGVRQKPISLHRLQSGDFRHTARMVSCQQEIASEGTFSAGMIAELESSLEEGPWWYRRLFWESGALGQSLYLEVENQGLRGTGIGCFFDDPVHEMLGLGDRRFQSLYHFTAGGPVEDTRLRTVPAYAHLGDRSSPHQRGK